MTEMEQVAKALAERSAACERDVIGVGIDRTTGEPVGAMVLVGPNCVMCVFPFRDAFIEACCN